MRDALKLISTSVPKRIDSGYIVDGPQFTLTLHQPYVLSQLNLLFMKEGASERGRWDGI